MSTNAVLPDNELTFRTTIRADQIKEVADLVVKDEDFELGRGRSPAKIAGSIVFRDESRSGTRTDLSREAVLEMIREADPEDFIELPLTKKSRDVL